MYNIVGFVSIPMQRFCPGHPTVSCSVFLVNPIFQILGVIITDQTPRAYQICRTSRYRGCHDCLRQVTKGLDPGVVEVRLTLWNQRRGFFKYEFPSLQKH